MRSYQKQRAPGRASQVKATPSEHALPSAGNQAMLDALKSKERVNAHAGRALTLEQEFKGRLEQHFGYSVDTIEFRESQEASKIDANAFTKGNVVQFAPGKFDQNSVEGQARIAHELTHVMQQSLGHVHPTEQNGIALEHGFEDAAERAGAQFALGGMAQPAAESLAPMPAMCASAAAPIQMDPEKEGFWDRRRRKKAEKSVLKHVQQQDEAYKGRETDEKVRNKWEALRMEADPRLIEMSDQFSDELERGQALKGKYSKYYTDEELKTAAQTQLNLKNMTMASHSANQNKRLISYYEALIASTRAGKKKLSKEDVLKIEISQRKIDELKAQNEGYEGDIGKMLNPKVRQDVSREQIEAQIRTGEQGLSETQIQEKVTARWDEEQKARLDNKLNRNAGMNLSRMYHDKTTPLDAVYDTVGGIRKQLPTKLRGVDYTSQRAGGKNYGRNAIIPGFKPTEEFGRTTDALSKSTPPPQLQVPRRPAQVRSDYKKPAPKPTPTTTTGTPPAPQGPRFSHDVILDEPKKKKKEKKPKKKKGEIEISEPTNGRPIAPTTTAPPVPTTVAPPIPTTTAPQQTTTPPRPLIPTVPRTMTGQPRLQPVPTGPRTITGQPRLQPVPTGPRTITGQPRPQPIPTGPRTITGQPQPRPTAPRTMTGQPRPQPIPTGPRIITGQPQPRPTAPRTMTGQPRPLPIPTGPRTITGQPQPQPIPTGPRTITGQPQPRPTAPRNTTVAPKGPNLAPVTENISLTPGKSNPSDWGLKTDKHGRYKGMNMLEFNEAMTKKNKRFGGDMSKDKTRNMADLLEMLNYAQVPEAVSKEAFDKQFKGRENQALYRGLVDEGGQAGKMMQNLRSGNLFVGGGTSGSGTYFASGQGGIQSAMTYANRLGGIGVDSNKALEKGEQSSLGRFGMKKGARTIDEEELKALREKELQKHGDKIDSNLRTMIEADLGFFASMMGYDGLTVDKSPYEKDKKKKKTWHVALNRGMMISDTTEY